MATVNDQPSIILLDICGTLYASNTTFDFLDFHVRTRQYRMFRRLTRKVIWRAFNKLLFQTTGLDLTRRMAVRFLKGSSRIQLKAAADAFYAEWLQKRTYDAVHSLVKGFQEMGKTVVIVSATLDFIAQKVADSMGVNIWYSTCLEYNDDRCAGRIQVDLLAKKLAFLTNQGIQPPFFATITDNYSDMELILQSHRAVIVTNQNQYAKWQRLLKLHPSVTFVQPTIK